VQTRPKVRLSPAQALKLPKRPFAESDADENCCICLEPYAHGAIITTLRCKHYFHHDCIKPWLQEQQRVCPICKRDPFGPVEPQSERTPLLSPPPSGEIDEESVEAGHVEADESTEGVRSAATEIKCDGEDAVIAEADTRTTHGGSVNNDNHHHQYEADQPADDHASVNGPDASLSSRSTSSE
jgi:hypothetical protein